MRAARPRLFGGFNMLASDLRCELTVGLEKSLTATPCSSDFVDGALDTRLWLIWRRPNSSEDLLDLELPDVSGRAPGSGCRSVGWSSLDESIKDRRWIRFLDDISLGACDRLTEARDIDARGNDNGAEK